MWNENNYLSKKTNNSLSGERIGDSAAQIRSVSVFIDDEEVKRPNDVDDPGRIFDRILDCIDDVVVRYHEWSIVRSIGSKKSFVDIVQVETRFGHHNEIDQPTHSHINAHHLINVALHIFHEVATVHKRDVDFFARFQGKFVRLGAETAEWCTPIRREMENVDQSDGRLFIESP
uniref:Uncharacterized protein n=1 Tax=Romanomermis culicivorax TaxID=13658 RepID=A0A915IND8_ROMCU